jgi:hypothetical protein
VRPKQWKNVPEPKYSQVHLDSHNQIDYILVDGRRWILKRDVGAWSGLIWLRIGMGGIVYQIAVTKSARNFLHLDQQTRFYTLSKVPGLLQFVLRA